MLVARSIALRALRAAGPPHSPKKLSVIEHPDSWWVTVSDNEKWTLMEYLPTEIIPQTINHLCDRFEVPKLWFYEPLAIPGEETEHQPC
jgi:hypothetical protein